MIDEAQLRPDRRSLSLIVEAACGAEEARRAGWHLPIVLEPEEPWLYVEREGASIPDQGWKVHVSANTRSAVDVLERCLPVLLKRATSFKLAASMRILAGLNEGGSGLSQVGKFITVYPESDEDAVVLAGALDEATRGFEGPAIPSDRPLVPGSLVHYRYGGFGSRLMQTPLGEILPALVTPAGDLVPDRRFTTYRPLDWTVDPFVAAGVAAELPTPSPLVGGRFLVVSTLARSARGTVHLAVDVEAARGCILKRAARAAMVDIDGRGAEERLRHEAGLLARLGPDRRFPAFHALGETADEVFLALEDVQGESLEAHVGALVVRGATLPAASIIAWGGQLADALGALHARGVVYRDLKSANVIVTPDGRVRLIDFDIAHDTASRSHPLLRGTSGYMSPQQFEEEPPAAADDVYALGAVLHFLMTHAEPSQAPAPRSLLDRPVRVLNPAARPDLEAVVRRCLEADPARRFPSAAAVASALSACGTEPVPAPFGRPPGLPDSEPAARERCREQARRVGDSLVAAARPAPEGVDGLAWVSLHETSGGIRSLDLNSGSGGTLLALAGLVAVLGVPAHRECLAKGARWLTIAPRIGPHPLPGLYVGEAGLGLALLRAGQVLGDGALIEAAVSRGRFVGGLPHASPDLFNGTAGRLRFHLSLWDATGDQEHVGAAVGCGEILLKTARENAPGELSWTIPAGYDGLSGQTNLGYAHGAAGIGDALLDLFEATGDHRYAETACGAARWLERLAVPALDDGSGLAWPVNEGEKAGTPFWCHGATGIGRFFLHLWHLRTLGAFPRAEALARGAARSAARGARWANATQCHGLAGSIELLLDVYQSTGEPAYLAEARSLAQLLDAWSLERDGHLVWLSDMAGLVTPDYMVGHAGVAVCLLRLADPEHQPHQLGRDRSRVATALV